MKKLALHWKILLGIILGIVVGIIAAQISWGAGFIQDWIKPFGTIFINALKLIAIPLIVVSLIKGISDLKDVTKLSKMGIKTFAIYIGTTIIAVSLGLILVNWIQPGTFISDSTRTEMLSTFGGEVDLRLAEANRREKEGKAGGGEAGTVRRVQSAEPAAYCLAGCVPGGEVVPRSAGAWRWTVSGAHDRHRSCTRRG